MSPDQSRVYVANNGSATVSVISTATNRVIATIPVGTPGGPVGVAISPDGKALYVANAGANSVSVIATATNTVTATITVGSAPFGIAVSADGGAVYVTNEGSSSVSVISTAGNDFTVTATIPVGFDPRGLAITPDGSKVYVATFSSNAVWVIAVSTGVATKISDPSFNAPQGVAVTPDGSKVYVTNFLGNTVSVITTANDMVIPVVSGGSSCSAAIPVGSFPDGVTVSPDGTMVYVANQGNDIADGTVSVISTASNTVTNAITVGRQPVALGVFIIQEVMSVPLSGTACNGVYSGTFTGNITVSAGQNCTFIDGGTVIGNVTVQSGGQFSSSGTKIQGNLTIAGGTWSQIKNTQVAGDVQISGSSATPTTSTTISPAAASLSSSTATPAVPTGFLCGTTVIGDLTFDNNGASAQIGAANPLICAGNTITGTFEANNNTGALLIFDNAVGKDMRVLKNTGLLDVVGNNVSGNLHCQNNSMLILGGMNTAKNTQGPCGP